MKQMNSEALVEVVTGDHHADITLGEIESIGEITEQVIDAAEDARPEIVIDLRCHDRPAVPLLIAMEVAVDALREIESRAKLRFLVLPGQILPPDLGGV